VPPARNDVGPHLLPCTLTRAFELAPNSSSAQNESHTSGVLSGKAARWQDRPCCWARYSPASVSRNAAANHS
jgi:hypothetical protein